MENEKCRVWMIGSWREKAAGCDTAMLRSKRLALIVLGERCGIGKRGKSRRERAQAVVDRVCVSERYIAPSRHLQTLYNLRGATTLTGQEDIILDRALIYLHGLSE